MVELFMYPDIDFVLGEYKGTPVLYHDGYNYFRRYSHHKIIKDLGLYTYHVRHADDGDWVIPCSLEEKHVMVNYCGFIISPVDLFLEYPTFVEKIDWKLENGGMFTEEFISLTKEEGYDITDPLDEDGTGVGYIDFLEVFIDWREKYGIEFKG